MLGDLLSDEVARVAGLVIAGVVAAPSCCPGVAPAAQTAEAMAPKASRDYPKPVVRMSDAGVNIRVLYSDHDNQPIRAGDDPEAGRDRHGPRTYERSMCLGRDTGAPGGGSGVPDAPIIGRT